MYCCRGEGKNWSFLKKSIGVSLERGAMHLIDVIRRLRKRSQMNLISS